MKVHTLIRWAQPTRTDGILNINGATFKVVEREWANNKKNESCIQDDIYEYKIDMSTKRGYEVIELLPKNNRSEIQIHPVGDPKYLKGCVGTGTKKEALEIRDLMGPHGFLKVQTINKNLIER